MAESGRSVTRDTLSECVYGMATPLPHSSGHEDRRRHPHILICLLLLARRPFSNECYVLFRMWVQLAESIQHM